MARPELDEAAIAALIALRDLPVEHIGLLFDAGEEGLKATPVQTQEALSRARGKFEIPEGSLRGIFHNHPLSGNAKRDKLRREFSPDDIAMAQKLGVPTYLLAGDEIKVFDPKTMRPLPGSHFPGELVRALQQAAERTPPALSDDPRTGETADVLAQFPIEEMKRQLMIELLGRSPDDPLGLYRTDPANTIASSQ